MSEGTLQSHLCFAGLGHIRQSIQHLEASSFSMHYGEITGRCRRESEDTEAGKHLKTQIQEGI